MGHNSEAEKVSVICTVFNEEESVATLIESLLNQSRRPDELVITDGGSIDRTVDVINSFSSRGVPITLIVEKGVNISKGRNIAIRNSKFDIIACIDGGSIADSQWLENIAKPFRVDSKTNAVAGFFLPKPETEYEEVISELLYPKLEYLREDNFLPSARSMAFRRMCWEAVGGFPEYLYTGEDALFDVLLKDKGYNFVFAKDAIVYWRPRGNLQSLAKQYYLYAKGATEAGIIRTNTIEAYGENSIIYLSRVTGDLLFRLIRNHEVKRIFLVPLVITIVFLGKVLGVLIGLTSRRKLQRNHG